MQYAAGASVVPQVFVCENVLAPLPDKLIEAMVSAAVPALDRVDVAVVEGTPADVVKLRVAGESAACGVPVTVPLSATVWVAGIALSLAVSVAL